MPNAPDSGEHSSAMDLMVAAAVSHLHECEIKCVEVDEIARRAGIDSVTARTIFPTDDALGKAVDTYGMLRLSDAINKASVAAPPGDGRSALIGMMQAYVDWARANPMLYLMLSTRTLQFPGSPGIVRRYDASFVPLIRRYLGETEDVSATRRAAMLRSFLSGLTHIVLDAHLPLWSLPNDNPDAEIAATIEDFVDMLLTAPPAQPIRSEA